MKENYNFIIVGGGVVGVSIAYHLAKAGVKDILLVERDELTSGSTWHAAGLLPLFNMSYAASHIHDYSIKLYDKLKDLTGLSTGIKKVGNLRMAQSQDRMNEFMLYASTADTLNIQYEWFTPKQIKKKWPLIRTDDLKGAIFHPTDGYINPADLTQSLAKGARDNGVKIKKKFHVEDYQWTGNNWRISGFSMLEKGGNLIKDIERKIIFCENLITATGNHAQKTAKKLGIKTPAIPVEHQYIITEEDKNLIEYRKNNPEHPVIRDADAKWYVREERYGWILGPYEKNSPSRFHNGVPDNFRADLFPLDLERIEKEYMSMIHRIPTTENLGIKDDFNGPICYTPDGNPLVGPAPGLKNLWLAEGFSFGITAAGGVGKYLTDLILHGETEIDLSSLDPRRFGDWITKEYSSLKNEEAYEHVFILHHPDEEREACRPLKTSPCYDRMRKKGAQFGCVNGWERPNYFASESFNDKISRSFKRGKWWKYSVKEAEAVRNNLGLIDNTAFTKHLIYGKNSTEFLDWFTCNKLPKISKINLTYALNEKGNIRSEFTIIRLEKEKYYLISSGAWQKYDGDFLEKSIEAKAHIYKDVKCMDITSMKGVFSIAGPKTRMFLQKAIGKNFDNDFFSNERFPWLSSKEIEIGMCPVTAIRVSYTGELGWELHHPIEMQNYLFDLLEDHGEEFNLQLVGARAQNWLRQEKSYAAFGNELGSDVTPIEAGLERFIDKSKKFNGKNQLLSKKTNIKCITMLISDTVDKDPWGREAIFFDGKKVGRLTSGGYSTFFKKSIGMGYIETKYCKVGTKLKVKILNELHDAIIVENSPYDPKNEKVRKDF